MMKGKSDPIPAFRLIEVTSGVAGVARRLDSPMVGRDRQLAQLRQAFDAAVDDRSCQLFTVLGAPGVGKSRLVAEFLGAVQGESTVLRGRCLPYGEGITFFPVGEVVKEALGSTTSTHPRRSNAKICAILEDGEQGAACATLAAALRGRRPRQRRRGDVLGRADGSWSRSRRRVRSSVVFDDIQWGEPTFLDLIEHIADWSRDAPILVLCMARPELLDARPVWGGGKLNAATISLERLSRRGLRRADRQPAGDAPRCRTRRATGSWRRPRATPLFVEEMLSMLIDDGLLVLEGDRWIATGDLANVSVPPTIQALLAARLDRLSDDERAVIERGGRRR